MTSRLAAAGSVAWFVVAPGVVGGLIPASLVGWEVRAMPDPLRAVGVALIIAGLAALLDAFRRFVTEGIGTPAPVAPTQRLVVGGLYRFVRNPMYLAVLAAILGEALFLGQPSLLLYGVGVGIVLVGFVEVYEEPTLRRRFGSQHEAYRRAVPKWWPRLTPWTPSGRPERSTAFAGGRPAPSDERSKR